MTSPEKLLKLSKDVIYTQNRLNVFDLLKNPNLPLEAFSYLAENQDFLSRSKVAIHPNTPIDLLIKLSSDDDWYVRSYIAENPNTPLDILIKLNQDNIKCVRGYTSRNSKFKKFIKYNYICQICSKY